jgi:hypothetical protein
MASSQVGEMRKYDMKRDNQSDTELSHLQLESCRVRRHEAGQGDGATSLSHRERIEVTEQT